MIPLSGPRLVGSALLAAVGLVGAVATARPEPAVAAAPFVVAVLVGLVAGGRPSATAEVVASSTRAVAGDEIEVVATVRSSAAGHRAVARLRVPAELELVDGAPSVADLLAGGRATFRWRLRAERWGGVGRLVVEVGVVDRMGMRRTEVTGASAPLRVLPDEAALRRILSPRSLRTIPGGHSSRHRGEGIEFADMRPFVPGDRARSVNWRASARRGELWVDERHPERSGEVVLFLDSFVAAGHGRDRRGERVGPGADARREPRALERVGDGRAVGRVRRRTGSVGRRFDRPIGCRRVHRRAGADLDGPGARRHRDATRGHRDPRARAAPGSARRIADRLLDDELGAAHADRRRRRDQPVVLMTALADRAGDRAQRAPREREHAALRVAVEPVLVDAEPAAGLQRHDRAVGEPKLRPAVLAGLDAIAREQRIAVDRTQRALRAGRAARDDDVAGDHPEPRVLRGRRARRERGERRRRGQRAAATGPRQPSRRPHEGVETAHQNR